MQQHISVVLGKVTVDPKGNISQMATSILLMDAALVALFRPVRARTGGWASYLIVGMFYALYLFVRGAVIGAQRAWKLYLQSLAVAAWLMVGPKKGRARA